MLKKTFSVLLFAVISLCFVSCHKQKIENDFLLEKNFFLEREQISSIQSLALAGNPHWGSEESDADERLKSLNQIGKRSFDAFICLGDIAVPASGKNIYKNPVQTFNQSLKGIPVLSLSGELEKEKKAKQFSEIFYGLKKSPACYQMDFADVHLLFLNLEKAIDKSVKEKKWIESQLRQIPSDEKTIVFSFSDFINSDFVSIFEENKVDLVVSGNSHKMSISEKDGVYYITAGSMGTLKNNSKNVNLPETQNQIWENNSSLGFVDLNLSDENKISFAFFDSNGKHLKSYEIRSK
ncbi:MAG: metallophosphoesterase family protein [Treponema sp.]|nr:metallophosphoesterase family protein [Treponema sp.]